MGETDLHRQDMMDLIVTLEDRFADDPDVHVSGDLLLFHERGNRRKHLAPDAFVVFGVPKRPPRDHYLLWKEKKAPDVVIEITSKTTRREDQTKKLTLYRDVLKVPEYFQFDPTEDYLRPPMQGFRLVGGRYEPIPPRDGRLPSERLGLHFERDGTELRLYDPIVGRRLPTRKEAMTQARAEAAEAARHAAEADLRANQAVAENDRLRLEIEELKRRLGGANESGGA
ncbi:MAG: Uma2 family endonuclease [Isosphaeraceae bacterium]